MYLPYDDNMAIELSIKNFDFVYRWDDTWLLFYDWETKNLRKVQNPSQWVMRWDKQKKFDEIQIKSNMDLLYMQVPVRDWISKYTVISDEFKSYITNKAKLKWIKDIQVKNWIKFFSMYDVIQYDWTSIVSFLKKQEEISKELDTWLFLMKSFLYGVFRISPIRELLANDTHKKTETKETYIWTNYIDDDENSPTRKITYKRRWKEYKTPLFWAYMSKVIKEVIWPFRKKSAPEWKYLMERQRLSFFLFWGINFLMHSRWWWKSIFLSILAYIFSQIEQTDATKRVKPITIHYYWKTDADNAEIIEYIKTAYENWWKRYMSYSESKKTLFFFTIANINWEEKKKILGRVTFKSSESKGKGRWGRPAVVILDEAATLEKKLFNAIIWNYVRDNTIIFALSTIDINTPRNWFYEEAVQAEFRQMDYENPEDLVVRIWKKYKLDEIKSVDEFDDDLLDKINEAKKEYLLSRPRVCLRYTIDDIDEWVMSAEEKRRKLQEVAHMGKKYIASEFFSTLIDNDVLFAAEGILTDDIPERFDMIVLSYDRWWEYDNASLVWLWVKNNRIYIFHSEILPRNVDSQLERIKEFRNYIMIKLEPNHIEHIHLVVDCTRGQNEDIRDLWNYEIDIDYPVYISPWNTPSKNWSINRIPKKQLIMFTKDCIDRWYLSIDYMLDVPEWLIEEMGNFWIKKTSAWWVSYEALKGKDDQVMAMTMWIYYIYVQLDMKSEFIEWLSKLQKNDKSIDYMVENWYWNGLNNSDENIYLYSNIFNF